mgnify:CR=1 FL=1
MKRALKLMVGVCGVFALGLFAINSTIAQSEQNSEIEERINANLLRVKVNGEWHQVPMVELSERLCKSDHQMFRRYCD